MTRRKPTPTEIDLWRSAMRDARPLKPAPRPIRLKEPARAPAAAPLRLVRPAPIAPPSPPPKLTAAGLAPFAGIDKRSVERLRRGKLAIEARLDLHGMTQARAHAALIHFIDAAADSGKRTVLIITGKGQPVRNGLGSAGEAGILRRSLPHWLSAARLRPLVLALAPAQPVDGGSGAFYVRLRRRREP